jgi:hypothetical protein
MMYRMMIAAALLVTAAVVDSPVMAGQGPRVTAGDLRATERAFESRAAGHGITTPPVNAPTRPQPGVSDPRSQPLVRANGKYIGFIGSTP